MNKQNILHKAIQFNKYCREKDKDPEWIEKEFMEKLETLYKENKFNEFMEHKLTNIPAKYIINGDFDLKVIKQYLDRYESMNIRTQDDWYKAQAYFCKMFWKSKNPMGTEQQVKNIYNMTLKSLRDEEAELKSIDEKVTHLKKLKDEERKKEIIQKLLSNYD